MIQHSKLPWAITTTPKGSKQITDARGGVVANLTALDMSNAELIVASVNATVPAMPPYISKVADFKPEYMYWAVCDDMETVEAVKFRGIDKFGTGIFNNKFITASDTPDPDLMNYRFYGPIPEPDFNF